jgi:hypothetical protein
MTFQLHLFPGDVKVVAESEGIAVYGPRRCGVLTSREHWPEAALDAPLAWRTAVEIEQLLELGLAEISEGEVVVPYSNLSVIDEEMPVEFPRAWVKPNPFLLAIDRKSDLGRSDFQYKYKFLLGGHSRAIERRGIYVKQTNAEQIYWLDQQMYSLVEAIDAFNRLPAEKKTRQQTWLTFAKVKGCAREVGAVLDATLERNEVIVPSTIGLDIREHPDGALSFLPKCPELAKEEFQHVFERNSRAENFYSLDRPDLGRVRIVLTDQQHEVLRRMKRVRRVTGPLKESLKRDPGQAFEGVMDHVKLPYGERVIGVGSFEFSPVPRQGFRDTTMSDLWRGEGGGDNTGVTPVGIGNHQCSDHPVDEVSSESGNDRVGKVSDVNDTELTNTATTGTSSEIESGSPSHIVLLIDNNDESVRESFRQQAEQARRSPGVWRFQCPSALRKEFELHVHQREGVQWLQTCIGINGRRGVLLADDMGVGKTIQVLTFLAWCIENGKFPELSKDTPPFRPILVVVPLILLENRTWEVEMEKFFENEGAIFWPVQKIHGGSLSQFKRDDAEGQELTIGKPILELARLQRYRVVITNYETVRNYQHSFAHFVNGKPLWSVIVADEAQEFKVPNSKISHAMKALGADFQIACTGTPVENRLLDLWNICDTIQPGILSSAKEFMDRFEKTQSGQENLEDLKRTLLFQKPHAFVLRRNKSDVAKLPQKHTIRIQCEMTTHDLKLHQELLDELRGTKSHGSVLKVLQRLALLSQHSKLLSDNAEDLSCEVLVSTSPKLQALIRELHYIRGRKEKAIIFARHRAMQSILAKTLSKEFDLPVRIINGETKTKSTSFRMAGQGTRQGILQEFKHRAGFNILILSPFVAGIGLTITEANHVFHYGRWWNPAVESQATDRVYRIGQQKEVFVYIPIYRDGSDRGVVTFDESLDALMDRKYRLAQEFLRPLADEERFGEELAQDLLSGANT